MEPNRDERYDKDTAKKYQRLSLRLHLLKAFLGICFLAFLILSGASVMLESVFTRLSSNPWLVAGGYFLAFSLIAKALFLPLSYYRGFTIEHRFGLSNETRWGWLKDVLKASLIGLLLGGALTELVYFFLRRFPESWWLLAFLLFTIVAIVLARLTPVLILPLFFRFRALSDEDLTSRLLRLAEESRVKVCGVFEMDLSKKTKAANAALMGLGKTRRIVLADTLLEKFTPDEIETVLAHELGHHKHRDMWLAILTQSAISFMGFYLAHRALHAWALPLGFSEPASVATLPLLALTASGVSILCLIPANAFSRWLEGRADDFALRLSGKPGAFKRAMQKLASLNLADCSPHPLVEFVFYSHPSIARRIRKAESAEAR